MGNVAIAVDFDGTIVKHLYPAIGAPVPGAIETLKRLVEAGHSLILFTMRSGPKLDEAVAFLAGAGIDLWGVNTNPYQHEWTESPKAYASLYIDDAALGCPLVRPREGRPYVNWREVERICIERGLLAAREDVDG